ncbi:MAG: hypothetical protein DWP98_12665 [Bacteroidetes bacterium]|nr:MAG: hypothetical protein DWP98_12665 [Bacteroidota bacterium]MBL1143604.1 hypothetical protein [Bacteroidota bacterium]
MNFNSSMTRLLYLVSLLIILTSCQGTKEIASKTDSSNLSEKQKIEFGESFIDGTKEKILGNYEAAEKLIQKAIAIDPESAAAHYELGLIYNYQKNFKGAYESFEKANQIDPSNYWYKLSYATFLESNGHIEKAIKMFKELAEESPSQIELRYELSKLLVGQQRYQEGIEVLNQIEEKIGVNEEISFLKQRIYLYQNDVGGAAKEVKHLIDAYPSEIRYYGVLSDIYMSNDMDEKAYEVFQQMKALDSNSYFVHFSLAEYHRKKGDQVNYLKELKLAFENPEMNIDDKVKYVLTYYQVDSRDEAQKKEGISLCESITKGHPENAKSHALYADFLYFDNQVENAKQAYLRTVALDSSRFPVWNQLLVILSETNDVEKLVSYGKRAVELFPNQPTPYLLVGIGLAQQKKDEEAITYYSLGKDLVIDNRGLKGQFYASIGDAYHALKKHELSDENYMKALEQEPNNVYVLNNFSYYLSLRKENLEKAKEMSLKSNNLSPGQSSFQDTYAWVLFQLGDYEAANLWIDKALSNDGASGVLLEHKGDILYKLGKVNEALEFWIKAKEKGDTSELLEKKIRDKKWYE